MIKLATAALIHIKDRKLLLAFSNNKQCFYLPGGKVDAGETSEEALCREIEEELNVALTKSDLQYHTHISAPAYGEPNGIIMEQDCFLTSKEITPKASAEIGQLNYFTLNDYNRQINQAPGAVLILKLLKDEGRID
jgi:8-oxo-dGTP pyrophosphatase MutT (NUDIX family)